MWRLPTSLRARMSLAVLLGIFLIPLTTSSLRGLSHVLTCRDEIPATVVVDSAGDDDTVLLSADSVTADDQASAEVGSCDGIFVDLQLAPTDSADEAGVVVTVANRSDADWQGTIALDLSGSEVPVAIGTIEAGQVASDTVTLSVDADRSYEITATLLIGP